jgi:hypothetical protein
MRRLFFAIVLLCSASPALAQSANVPVPLINQNTNQWCWLASAQMVLAYLGVSVPQQCVMLEQGYNLPYGSCCGNPDSCAIPGHIQQIQTILQIYGRRYSFINAPANPIILYNIFANGRPVIAHLSLSTGGHFVVLRGIRFVPSAYGMVGLVAINDPMQGSSFELPFSQLINIWDVAVYVQ